MTKHLRGILAVALLLGVVAGTTWAGGPNHVYDSQNRVPYAWNLATWTGGAVPVFTDLGNFKNASPLFTNEQADQLVVNSWGQWNGVPTSSFQAQVVGDFSLIGLGNIDRTNAELVIGPFNGGGVHVIYDHDGQLLGQRLGLFGVLGVTSLEFAAPNSPELLEAWVVLNGSSLRNTDPAGVAFAGVLTHEFGHALNLGHSQANGATIRHLDPPQPRGCAAPWTGTPGLLQLETMYPFLGVQNPTDSGAGQAIVDQIDDVAAISNLYPEAGWPQSHGTIRGRVLLSDGTEVTAANVIARNVANPFGDFTSYISGQVTKGLVGPDGSFELNGLTPGAEYALYLDNLISGAYNVPRLVVLPGPEEYYNEGGEGGDGLLDDRCVWTTVTATPGAPVTVDLAFNKVKHAPVLNLLPFGAVPTDMTADGRTIVGQAGSQVFRLSDATGFEVIGGDISNGSIPSVSNDGSRIAASARNSSNIQQWALYENGAWTLLPPRPGSTTPCSNNWGIVTDISGNGQAVVGGMYSNGCATAGFRATKWNATEGSEALEKSADSPTRANRANATNYDGSVIAGWDDHATGLRRGAYWLNGQIHVISPDPAVSIVGEGLDLNTSGSLLVGQQAGATKGAWKLFTATGQMEMLSDNTADLRGTAYNVNDNGDVVMGWTTLTGNLRVPTIWTPQLGWTNFNLFLEAQGTTAEGIGIANATAISADGRTIAGHAATQFGTTGWLVQTPYAMVCHREPGSTQAPVTINVGFPEGLDEHLGHSDTLGLCQHGGL